MVPPPASASERAVPAETPVRDLRFGYSMGERVVTWKRDEVEVLRTTANVLPTLRIDAAEFVDGDYAAGALQQRARLGGMAEVRIDPSLPSPSGTDRHMFLSLADELGSSTVILDHETGELAERVTYQTYGATDQDLRPARWGAHREPMRFTGKEDDVEIGLTYFGARYYAPNLHQWASADPLAIHAMGADLNPYAYVSGRATTSVDPFGLAPCSAPGNKDATCDTDDGGKMVPGTGDTAWEISGPASKEDTVVVRGERAMRDDGEWRQGNVPMVDVGRGYDTLAALRPLNPVLDVSFSTADAGVKLARGAMKAHANASAHPAHASSIWGAFRQQVFITLAPVIVSGLIGGAGARSPAGPLVGGGSGPWAPNAVRSGGAVAQSLPGSCGAACVEMLSGGATTEAQALAGGVPEWSPVGNVAGALGAPWKSGMFAGSADAVAAAGRGPMGAVLWSPGARAGHMVVIEPQGSGFLVRDPLPGVNYSVGGSWVERWVAGGVWK